MQLLFITNKTQHFKVISVSASIISISGYFHTLSICSISELHTQNNKTLRYITLH